MNKRRRTNKTNKKYQAIREMEKVMVALASSWFAADIKAAAPST